MRPEYNPRAFRLWRIGRAQTSPFDAVRGIDVSLQRSDTRSLQAVLSNILVGGRQVLGVETDDVGDLMPAKVTCHARLGILAILAGKNFKVIVREHNAEFAIGERFDDIALLPGTGVF